jgi:hypothetical protein
LKANSYAELLEQIPSAGKVLQALDEQAPAKSSEDNVKVAQLYHHHHHHHGVQLRSLLIPCVMM